MPADDTFWGRTGQRILGVLAFLMAILIGAPAILLLALPWLT